MAAFTFGPLPLFDPIADLVVENASSGKFVTSTDPAAVAQPVYDMNGSPLASITSNSSGQVYFQADIGFGYVRFGSLVVAVISNEAFQAALDASSAAAAALAAASAAQSAAAAAQAQAAATAAQLASYIAAGGGSGSGSVSSAGIADATPVGRALLTAPTAAAALAQLGGVATGDTRLSDARTPADGSVTNAKVASNAAISADKLADGTTNKVMTSADKLKLASAIVSADGTSHTLYERTAAQGAPDNSVGSDGDIALVALS